MMMGKNVSTGKPIEVPVAADGATVPVSGTLTAVVDESTLATSAKQDTGNTSVASIDGKIGASAAAGDTDANPTVGGVRAFLEVFGGATWQRVRNGITAVSSTLTGMINTLPWAQFNTTPTTRTNGQGGPLEADASGNLRSAEQNVVGWNFAHITAATTTVVKASAGVLGIVLVNTLVATATITIYDNTSAAGTIIAIITLPAAGAGDMPDPLTYYVTCTTGITVVTSGATDLTVTFL